MDPMGFQMPPMAQPPPITNQPPAIFGSYMGDGMPNLNMPNDFVTHMFPDSQMLMDESTEAKRRRIARVSIYVFCYR